MLHEHAQLKQETHRVYEITRALSIEYCLHPTWQRHGNVLSQASEIALSTNSAKDFMSHMSDTTQLPVFFLIPR